MANTAAVITQNLAEVRGRIADSANGRAIRLVAVTKYARPEWVPPLLSAGATELGENLLPRAKTRFDAWATCGPFTRHLLGAQQSRKVKLIPDACDLFQALHRIEVARVLEPFLASRHNRLDVLIEVNIDAEPQKHGFDPDQVEGAIAAIVESNQHLCLRGLMCIPKPRQSGESAREFERRTRRSYSTMAQLFARIGTSLPASARWDTLSMGMSQDFTWAIEEGATMVRIGSALFAGLEG